MQLAIKSCVSVMAKTMTTKQASVPWPRHWRRNLCQHHGLKLDKARCKNECRDGDPGNKTGVSAMASKLGTKQVSALCSRHWQQNGCQFYDLDTGYDISGSVLVSKLVKTSVCLFCRRHCDYTSGDTAEEYKDKMPDDTGRDTGNITDGRTNSILKTRQRIHGLCSG